MGEMGRGGLVNRSARRKHPAEGGRLQKDGRLGRGKVRLKNRQNLMGAVIYGNETAKKTERSRWGHEQEERNREKQDGWVPSPLSSPARPWMRPLAYHRGLLEETRFPSRGDSIPVSRRLEARNSYAESTRRAPSLHEETALSGACG